MANNKKVLIIYTGGTIGMKKSANGYTPAVGFIDEALQSIPDMSRSDFPTWDLYEISPLLDSSNMTVREWNSIASVIYERFCGSARYGHNGLYRLSAFFYSFRIK